MYNADLKKKFLDSYTRSEKRYVFCEYLFERVSAYESSVGRDVCTMDVDQISIIVDKYASGMREESTIQYLSVIRDYKRWCIKNGIEGAVDNTSELQSPGLSKIKSTMVVSPMHLQSVLDKMFDKESEETIDCTYRCFYWLAFAGANDDDIFDIKCSDVDFIEMGIHIKDYDVEIYRESIKAFRNAANLNSFVYKHPNYSSNIVRDRIPGDLLLRGIKGEPSMPHMKGELSRKSGKLLRSGKIDVSISYNRIWLSGVFYRMFELERMGMEITFVPIIKSRHSNLTVGRINLLDRQYMSDYQRWKLAFKI